VGAGEAAGAELRAALKYRNQPTEVDGIKFSSKKEAKRYADLKWLLRGGQITDLKLQPRFPLKVNDKLICTYVADFEYVTAAGETVVEDVKGVQTDVFKLKRKLMRACYDIGVVLT
jgi:hypothetical protein